MSADLLQFKGNPKPRETQLVDAQVVAMPSKPLPTYAELNLMWQKAMVEAFGLPIRMLLAPPYHLIAQLSQPK